MIKLAGLTLLFLAATANHVSANGDKSLSDCDAKATKIGVGAVMLNREVNSLWEMSEISTVSGSSEERDGTFVYPVSVFFEPQEKKNGLYPSDDAVVYLRKKDCSLSKVTLRANGFLPKRR